MPIRLLFLLLFLPSTFLSSLNLCHVDALALYEPHAVGWTGHLFQSSSQRAAFLTFLSSNSPPASNSEFTTEDLSALFVLWDASKRTTIGEDQSRSAYSSIIPPIFKQPNNFRQASIRLKKRQADEGESVTRTSNLREAAPDNQLLEAGLAPPGTESPELDSGKTQAPRGKSSPPASPKAPVPQTVSTKKAPEQPELFDAGLKGALIIGTAAILMGIYLVLRKKLTPEPESQMPVVYEKGGLDGPSAQASFGRNASISGPFGDSNAVDDSWQVKPGASRSEKVASLGTNRAQGGRLPARTPSLPGKTVALPSRVKVTKQMTKQPPPRQGQGVQARIPVPRSRGPRNNQT
ncbi:hypothetical protein MJO28_001038 [Puccinia striiformis f. sp. tritici]|uniref:Uncharacterized protein n=1 Tax=Puccinia striiformis f. sp. tritici TaxID=168172 RepID=A0ACC0F1E2_9BASI|nr:hypothetical protein Pst134EA_000214 [Puccinia striiformis f. sp. tritici]KAH9473138.1 hypothetical protein Pst134EA_000214 [Puccinia striiformis f. sp. tritici]KAI7962944.1 hypothetical protein MJO28_001038 [Puccinia striiformis f. sp. tritici]